MKIDAIYINGQKYIPDSPHFTYSDGWFQITTTESEELPVPVFKPGQIVQVRNGYGNSSWDGLYGTVINVVDSVRVEFGTSIGYETTSWRFSSPQADLTIIHEAP